MEKNILPKHILLAAKINPREIFETLPSAKINLRKKFRFCIRENKSIRKLISRKLISAKINLVKVNVYITFIYLDR